MEVLKIAQYYMNSISKEDRIKLFEDISVNYSIPDAFPGKQQNRNDWSGCTSLHFAVKSGNLDFTNELLQQGADLFKQSTEDGCTPLHMAMNNTFRRKSIFCQSEMSDDYYKRQKNEEIKEYKMINTLLSKQVEIGNTLNPKNKHGISHLHIACIVNHIEAVKFFAATQESLTQTLIFDLDDAPDDKLKLSQLQGYTPLHCAVNYLSVQAADILLQYGADVNVKNAKGRSCIHLMIERIIDLNDYINMGKRQLCMQIAEGIDKIESIIKSVLRLKACDKMFVDDKGLSAFHIACTLTDETIVEDFLKLKIDVNKPVKCKSNYFPGWTPLHFAACSNTRTMILLMQHGADITIKNSRGETPLDLCARRFTSTDIQLILSMKNEFNNIVLSDQSTKLSDLLLVMNDCDKFEDFLLKFKDLNLIIPFNSPIWAGYSLFHLSVALNNRLKICEDFQQFYELPILSKDSLVRYNCTENEEALYLKRIELCLKYGYSVIIKNANGQTPIHLAFSILKDKSIIEKLLSHSQEDVVDQTNLSLLHIACALGQLDTVKKYLSQGANVNTRVKKNFNWYKEDFFDERIPVTIRVNSTPMHVAIACGHPDLVKHLLENNADVYAKDSLGLTPIHLSMCLDSVVAQQLLKTIPNLQDSLSSRTGLTFMHVAAYAGDVEAIKQMLLNGAKIDSVIKTNVKEPTFLASFVGKTPLMIAEQHSGDAFKALLMRGANVHAKDHKGISVMQHCISIDNVGGGSTNVVIQMLKNGKCDAGASGITLLHFACGNFDYEWAKELLMEGADVNARINAEHTKLHGATPLFLLFGSDYMYSIDNDETIKLIKLLLDNGADVTIECCGCTSLHTIYEEILNVFDWLSHKTEVEFQQILDFADLLVESQKSHDINPIDPQGFSHFHFACATNNFETVKKFLDHGVDINHSVDPFRKAIGGFTPLHFAMAHESEEVAYLLMERGANVNAHDQNGNTPLDIAILVKFIDLPLIKTMLSFGVDINATILNRVTPLYSHLESGDLTLETLDFFLDRGCNIEIFMEYEETHEGIFGQAMCNAEPTEWPAILKKLIQLPEVKNAIENGFSPIHSIVAVQHDGKLSFDSYLYTIEFLMNNGCELDQQNTKGETALCRAARYSYYNLEAVNALLQLGADVNLVNFWEEHLVTEIVTDDANASQRTRDLAVVKTLAYYIWRMNFIGINVNHSNLRFLQLVKDSIPFDSSLIEQSCRYELTKAENTRICHSLYVKDFLSDLEAVAEYPTMNLVQRDIVEKFFKNNVDLHREFPELSNLLVCQYNRALARMKLLQPAKRAIVLYCQFELPDLCLEAVLKYFTNDEMKLIIKLAGQL